MLRNHVLAAAALLLALGAAGRGQPSSVAPPDTRLTPSFTWGEVPPSRGAAGLSGVYHRAAIVTEMSVTAHRFLTHAKLTYWCFFPDGRVYY